MTVTEQLKFSAKPAASYGDRKTDYIWYPYLVRQEVNILMCSGGTGKTYLSCLVASFISRGKTFPGDLKPQRGAEPVLIISGEDTGELLKERLSACGADLNKVFILDCQTSIGLNFGKEASLFQSIIQRYKPALTIIDPLQSFIGEEADLNKVNCIRPIMQRLAAMAKQEDTAILLIMHVNKRSQFENLNNAASGSTDFVNSSRSALYIIFDEEDKQSRLLIHSKSNYAPPGKTVRFTFDEQGGIYWNGYSEIDRFTVEEANRKRKTPAEIIKASSIQDETNETLIRALLDAASKTESKRFTYDAFKEKYGCYIFGSWQPKRLLDGVSEAMLSRGYKLETGKKIKVGETTKNGFLISPFVEPEEQTELPF